MTQAEKIKMLEAELKAERLEHEKAEAELKEYRKREEKCVFVQYEGVGNDGYGFWQRLVVRSYPASYGAGTFDIEGFHKSLEQFCKKWNEVAMAACCCNEHVKPKKGDGK